MHICVSSSFLHLEYNQSRPDLMEVLFVIVPVKNAENFFHILRCNFLRFFFFLRFLYLFVCFFRRKLPAMTRNGFARSFASIRPSGDFVISRSQKRTQKRGNATISASVRNHRRFSADPGRDVGTTRDRPKRSPRSTCGGREYG